MLKTYFVDFLRDARIFFNALIPKKILWSRAALLFAITLAAAIYRFAEIGNDISYDEAYTYLAFIRGSFWQTATDYHLPNNHIFLSLILNLTFRIFGGELWVLRIPTYLAGVLMIPASYALGKRLYSPSTGMLSAIAVSAFPELIQFSTVFRGYIIVAVFTLLVLVLGDELRRKKNRFGWAFLVMIFTLGLYTIPTMLFPFAILFFYFLFSVVVNDIGSSYVSKLDFLRYWLSSGILTGLATATLYSPILLFSRDDLFNHHWLIPVPWEILPNRMYGKLLNTWAEWTAPIPGWLVWLGVVGIIISFLFHKEFARQKIPLQIAFVAGIVTIILIQRPNAWPRVWSFAIGPLLVWASAGIVEPLSRFRIKAWSLHWAMVGIAFAALLWGGVQHIPDLSLHSQEMSNIEATADYLAAELQQDDLILIDGSHAPLLEYYLLRNGKSQKFFQREISFQRAIFVVVTKGRETLESMQNKFVEKYKLDINTFQLLRSYGNYKIYEVFPLQ